MWKFRIRSFGIGCWILWARYTLWITTLKERVFLWSCCYLTTFSLYHLSWYKKITRQMTRLLIFYQQFHNCLPYLKASWITYCPRPVSYRSIFFYIFGRHSTWLVTPPNSEIICGQNVGTKVVCGIIFFLEKKLGWKFEKNCGCRLEVTC